MLDAVASPSLTTRERDRSCRGIAGWAVARTHPQAERWADANLRRQGYRTFLPLQAVRIRDRVLPTLTRVVHRPIFPSYLFIHLSRRDIWRPIRETPGVHDVIRDANGIQFAAPGSVEALEALQELDAPPIPWEPGTPCSLASGPLRGMPAVVTAVSGNTARVAIMAFGALRSATLSLNCLIPREDA